MSEGEWTWRFRLGAECDHDEKVLDVYTIERRGGAYKADDD
jgi:mRNA interferase RelE/StbE